MSVAQSQSSLRQNTAKPLTRPKVLSRTPGGRFAPLPHLAEGQGRVEANVELPVFVVGLDLSDPEVLVEVEARGSEDGAQFGQVVASVAEVVGALHDKMTSYSDGLLAKSLLGSKGAVTFM